MYRKVWSETLASCRAICLSDCACTAFEFQTVGRRYTMCEIHSQKVTHTVPASHAGSSVCFAKPDGAQRGCEPAPRPAEALPPPPAALPPIPRGVAGAEAFAPPRDAAGCVRLTPRADFSTRGAEQCFTSEKMRCAWPTLPSGMAVPRHNVPMYTGNGPWDGQGLGFGGSVAALLGDPFQYVSTPTHEVLVRLLSGQDGPQLARAMRAARVQPPAAKCRDRYMDRWFGTHDSKFRRSELLASAEWRGLPRPVRDLAAASAWRLSAEAATCAAVALLDLQFEATPSRDLERRELLTAGFQGNQMGGCDPPCRGAKRQHVTFYSTPYQSLAHGCYGGNTTYVWRPNTHAAVHGSPSLDMWWKLQGCPGPCDSWTQRSLARPSAGRERRASDDVDAGETRTANYRLWGGEGRDIHIRI